MTDRYVEELPEEMAQVMLGADYDPSLRYQLITEADGTYVTALDKKTGRRVDLDVHEDATPDDLALDVENFSFTLDEEVQVEDNDYTVRSFGKWPYIIALSLLSCVGITGYVCYVLLLKGG